jgi:hypothetical protein
MTMIRDGGARRLGGAATAALITWEEQGRREDGRGAGQQCVARRSDESRLAGERDGVEPSGSERCGTAAQGKRRGRGRTDPWFWTPKPQEDSARGRNRRGAPTLGNQGDPPGIWGSQMSPYSAPTVVSAGGWYSNPTAGCCSSSFISHGGRTTSLQKIITFFINSNGDKFYAKILTFLEIYNFVVQTFSFEIILRLK